MNVILKNMPSTTPSTDEKFPWDWDVSPRPLFTEKEDEEWHTLQRMEKEWALSLPIQNTIQQLMELYPPAKTAAMRAVRKDMKYVKSKISGLSDYREAWSNVINTKKPKEQPALIKWLDASVAEYTLIYEKQLKKLGFELSYLQRLGHVETPETVKQGVTDVEIAMAKQTHISSLLDVKRRMAKCLWHEDSNPSLHVYNDVRVYCFVCNKAADVIELYMTLNGCDFITAVKALV